MTDIIIPIYNAYDYVQKCIETVILHTDLKRHGLILINDKSSDTRIKPLLDDFKAQHSTLNIKLIHNQSNLGFVKNVNLGLTTSTQDVVLLNSDTEVTSGWIDKLEACAYSKDCVATVTPLSNNATLASVPDFLVENQLPSHLSLD